MDNQQNQPTEQQTEAEKADEAMKLANSALFFGDPLRFNPTIYEGLGLIIKKLNIIEQRLSIIEESISNHGFKG